MVAARSNGPECYALKSKCRLSGQTLLSSAWGAVELAKRDCGVPCSGTHGPRQGFGAVEYIGNFEIEELMTGSFPSSSHSLQFSPPRNFTSCPKQHA